MERKVHVCIAPAPKAVGTSTTNIEKVAIGNVAWRVKTFAPREVLNVIAFKPFTVADVYCIPAVAVAGWNNTAAPALSIQYVRFCGGDGGGSGLTRRGSAASNQQLNPPTVEGRNGVTLADGNL